MVTFRLNGKPETVDVDADVPLLWVLRDTLGRTGTKYGCGIAQCGACTVHVGDRAVRSCVTAVGTLEGQEVTTIEGVARTGAPMERWARAVQAAWRAGEVAQCGYCQSGQIMSAILLLSGNRHPTDDDIDAAMSGNVCRCATYVRIRAAIHAAARSLGA